MKSLIIIGAGGHGRVVADIAQKMGVYKTIAFLDDRNITETMGFPVVGKVSDVQKYVDGGDIFVAIGDSYVRESLVNRLLQINANIPVLIHPSAIVGACVEIGLGTAVMAGAIINPCAKIGKGVILNTSCSVDHDCVIDNFAHISVGAHVAGAVNIGEYAWIGAGAVVKNNINISANCIIGAGAVVVKDVLETGIYVGVPAKKCKELRR